MSTLLCVTRCHREPLPHRQTHAIDLKSGRYGKVQRYCLSYKDPLTKACVPWITPTLEKRVSNQDMRTLQIQALATETHFAPHNTLQTHTLLPEHFTHQHILLPGTLCPSTQFAPTNTAPWNTLLPRTLCFLEHSPPWNTYIPGTHSSRVTFPPQDTLHPEPFFLRSCAIQDSRSLTIGSSQTHHMSYLG